MLLIAHQMQLVREADLIVVLEQGRVAGLGSHDQLALTCPAYQALLTDDESGAHGAIPAGSHS